MRENCYLNIGYSIYGCFVHKFDRITFTFNYKDGEINILAEMAWFDKYLRQFDVDEPGWKNYSNYDLYDSKCKQWEKFEKNTELVVDRKRGLEPCTKKFHEKCCRYCENGNWEHFEKCLDLVEEN